jgi:hypothetical protein
MPLVNVDSNTARWLKRREEQRNRVRSMAKSQRLGNNVESGMNRGKTFFESLYDAIIKEERHKASQ